MQLIRTNGSNTDFKDLVDLLDKNLWEIYPDTMSKYVKGNIVDHNVFVVLLYHDNQAIGCGCLRPFENDSTIELKRMFIRKEYRGKGLSKEIVKELLVWSKELMYKTVLLETGIKQPEAIGLYENMGFHRIEPYGEYIGNNESICMKKAIYK